MTVDRQATDEQVAASDVHDWDGIPDQPKWHDIYTEVELAAALRYAAAQLAKQRGAYELASELNFAADCIEDLAERPR